MEIDIDKEAQAFEQWFSAGDHNGCGIEIWLAAKRHAAQVAEPTDRQRSDANVEALLASGTAGADSALPKICVKSGQVRVLTEHGQEWQDSVISDSEACTEALLIGLFALARHIGPECTTKVAKAMQGHLAAMLPTKAGEGE